MLLSLTLSDFVIVDHLELSFESGFSALTGETGAGKSILIDALTLTLGERADGTLVREGRPKAEIAAVFDIGALPEAKAWLADAGFEVEDDLLLRRAVEQNGRSRAWINGAAATAGQLRGIGELLVDIHGQHAHQSLLRADAQRNLLDAHGGLGREAARVREGWQVWQSARAALDAASEGQEARAQEREALQWQIEELTRLAAEEGEWQELEAEQRRLSHAASLIENAQRALALLDADEAATHCLSGALSAVEEMAEVDEAMAEAQGLLESAQAEVTEALRLLRRYADAVELDPARLAEVESRQSAMLSLARKHRLEPENLWQRLPELEARLAAMEEAADLAVLSQKAEEAAKAYAASAKALSAGRQKTAEALSGAVSAEMRHLALASGRFEVALLPVEGGPNGVEQVEFRVAGLAAKEARPLAKVASGGELSRISLALQVV
ncbi:MAG: DNA repair protein RecN, partial [Zoogloeaceae bacterium]|nr:DNA repair protein RecN [Zoogloeaceae bacterium]